MKNDAELKNAVLSETVHAEDLFLDGIEYRVTRHLSMSIGVDLTGNSDLKIPVQVLLDKLRIIAENGHNALLPYDQAKWLNDHNLVVMDEEPLAENWHDVKKNPESLPKLQELILKIWKTKEGLLKQKPPASIADRLEPPFPPSDGSEAVRDLMLSALSSAGAHAEAWDANTLVITDHTGQAWKAHLHPMSRAEKDAFQKQKKKEGGNA